MAGVGRLVPSSCRMSRLQQLRVFVRERLSAAAEEILGALERTLLELEQEPDEPMMEAVGTTELLTSAEAAAAVANRGKLVSACFSVFKVPPPLQRIQLRLKAKRHSDGMMGNRAVNEQRGTCYIMEADDSDQHRPGAIYFVIWQLFC